MHSVQSFTEKYVPPVVVGAIIGACAGKVVGGLSAAGTGAAIGAIEAAISYPLDRLITHKAFKIISTVHERAIGEQWWSRANRGGYALFSSTLSRDVSVICNLFYIAKLTNRVITNATVWGGAVFLGVVSLPLAAVAAGVGMATANVDYLSSALVYNDVISAEKARLVSVAANLGVVALSTFALISLGVVAPYAALGLGTAWAVVTLASAYFKKAETGSATKGEVPLSIQEYSAELSLNCFEQNYLNETETDRKQAGFSVFKSHTEVANLSPIYRYIPPVMVLPLGI